MGGAQIFAYNLINQLSANNHEVHLYLPYKSYLQFKKLGDVNNYKVIPILRHENFTAKYWPGLIRLRLMLAQKFQKYDVWQVIGAYPAGWVTKDLTSKVPIILRSHGDDIQKNAILQYGLALNPTINQRISKTLNKVTHLVALTRTVEQCYIDFGVQKSRITEIHNGVNIENFDQNVDVENERKKLSIGKNQIFILSVGRYHKKKGYEFIPEALKLLISEGHDVVWVIVGKKVSLLENNFKKLGLESSVKLIEEIGSDTRSFSNLNFPSDDLIRLYKSADIFVMPSLLETFGMILLEAMASKLPVVSTNAPGCRDVVQHGKTGLVVTTSNSEALSKAIKIIIKDKNLNLKSKLVSNAYKFAKDHDWDKITGQYESLYKNILNRKEDKK